MESWQVRAWRMMGELAESGVGFYPDDLVERVGVPDGEHTANGANSAIGSMFRRARAAGLIEKTGRVRQSRQPKRKGGLVQEWRGVARDQGSLL